MKTAMIVSSLLLVSAATQAESIARPMPMKLRNGVVVERDLVSKDGQYLFLVNTGTWRVGGIMYNRANNDFIVFDGTQKGYNLTLQSRDNKKPAEYIFTGTLNLANNRIDGVMTTNTQKAITFEPYIPIAKRPTFQFKFFGLANPQNPNVPRVTQVQVFSNNKLVQTLSGFEASDYEATYADYNFDGYFDLRLDIGDIATMQSRHQYWLYNPKTAQFERDDFLSQISGAAQRYPHKNILRFNNKLLERRGNTWQAMPCCAAIN
ncbi:XAC2610-related protein [Neisseriaceae bacterium B1]